MDFFRDIINIDLEKSMGIYNSTDEFFCLFLNNIYLKNNKNILVVVNSIYEANKLYNSLSNYNDNVCLFPMDDFLTSEALAVSPELMINRLETINKIINGDKNIVITNLMGYLRYLPTRETYEKATLSLKVGDVISPSKLVDRLVSIGYSRDTIVNKTGEFGVRGFIIDVFPIDEDNPIRIEFFDDEIDSIRYFDSETQKSISKADSITIKPFFEFVTLEEVEEEEFGKQKYLPNYGDVSNISDYK
jgi:transcription-repair coupling factor (superfamily II helicase)